MARSSLVMASGTMASRILGVVRMAVLAWALGIKTPAGNIWQTANTIPNTIYLLLAAGVLNVLLLPQLTRAMTRGKEGQEFSDRLITLSVVLLTAGTVLFVLAAPLVTRLMMLEYPWDDPMLRLAILFAYLCIPQMLFYGLHTLLGQILAAYHRFAAFSWSPALANVIAIIGILIFVRLYPDAGEIPVDTWTVGMIWLLAGSATLGIIAQALVLFPAVRATGFQWRFRWGFRGVGLGTASVMAGWALADIGVSQTGMITATNLLNSAVRSVPDAPGKMAYDYAFSVFILPHSLIALSLLTAIYPILSKAAAADDRRGMASQVGRGLRMLATAMVPLALGMVLLAPLLTQVLYPSSTPEESRSVAMILIALTVGLVPYGIYLLCARVFYSFEDARTPFLFQVAITTILLTVCVLALWAAPGIVAILIALGQALGQTTAAVLGLRAVRRKLPWIGLRQVAGTYLRAAAAALLALVPAWLLMRGLLALLVDGDAGQERPGFVGAVLTLGLTGHLYLGVYAVLAHRLGVREIGDVATPLLRRVPGLSRFAPATPAAPVSTPDGVPTLQGEATPEGASTPAAPLASVEEELALPHTPEKSEVSAGRHAARASTTEMVDDLGTLGLDRTPSGEAGKDDEMDRLTVGTRLGDRYALDELLARREGGALDYWSAQDTTLGRLVAVTVLPATGDNAPIASAVLDGARRVASVDDPRLVRVLDVGSEDGLAWIVEEGLSDAESLASLVADRPLPAEEARRIIGEAASALESARRRGLHHLYLNPHAVLRTGDGVVKVSGVGVAAALEGSDDVTADEASIIDTADLVSLLYTGLTATWPGEELSGLRPARRLEDGSYPAPSESVGGVPGDLDTLCRLVLGPEEDFVRAPHSPGELARQLSPWSPDMVREGRPSIFTGPESSVDDASAAALSGTAGASAAAAAAHPPKHDDDATTAVPKPYYRQAHGQPQGAAGGDAVGGVSAAGLGAGAAADRGRREGDQTGELERPSTADMLGLRSTGERIQPRRPGSPGRPTQGAPESRLAATAARGREAIGLSEERGTGGQTAAVLLVLVGILGLAAVLGWSVLNGLGGGDDQPAASPSVSAPADAGATTGAGADDESAQTAGGSGEGSEDASDEAAPPAGGAPSILGITSYDPEGDGDERNDLTPLAVDGDEDTEWTSHTYLSPDWGGLKRGTGLILDLGEGATVSEVDVLLGEGDMGATVYLAERPTRSGATELSSRDDASGTWEIRPEQAHTGRYLIIWFDRAYTSSAGEIVSVREISVR
ncbi:murein biosynthesis integral membrane protein MurJ [Ornithinimicrobium panacihumi]|uniref:murein biosynthesis integral membrane protein MurJ n=1 Tax=Ornithinimicrobium panacihumi TaxID=2008449 RepID=UPI003F8C85BC